MIETRSEARRYADAVSLQAAQLLVVAMGECDGAARDELIAFVRRMACHARRLIRPPAREAGASAFGEPWHQLDEVAGAVADIELA